MEGIEIFLILLLFGYQKTQISQYIYLDNGHIVFHMYAKIEKCTVYISLKFG
jgi:hypothetical protein